MGVEVTVPTGESKVDEIIAHLHSIKHSLSEMGPMPEGAMSYTELKMQLMVNYVANLSYYVSLKHKGECVANHSVFKHLAYLRTFMERLAPLDAALKYQIDKLLLENTEEGSDKETKQESAAAPNLGAFMSSAVKSITPSQVKKSIDIPLDLEMAGFGDRLEIDPAMIAAQIQKAQERAAQTKTKRKVKTYVEEDSADERIDDDEEEFEEPVPAKKQKASKKTKKAAQKANKVEDDDDEEIDSDFSL
jgi:hypothetical protein